MSPGFGSVGGGWWRQDSGSGVTGPTPSVRRPLRPPDTRGRPKEEVELGDPVPVLGLHYPPTTLPNTGAIALSFLVWRTAAATFTRNSRTSRSWPASASKPASWSTRVVTAA